MRGLTNIRTDAKNFEAMLNLWEQLEEQRDDLRASEGVDITSEDKASQTIVCGEEPEDQD